MRQDLEKKVNRSIRLIKAFCGNAKGPVELAYSGGKDSDVILELSKMAGAKVDPIYKMTTIDPAYTAAHARSKGAYVVRPKYSFRDLIGLHGLPNRFKRFCCEYLKEYKIWDYVIVGIRRSESRVRNERYKEPTVCKRFPHGEKAEHLYPILDWDDQDVLDFIESEGVKLHPLYYDESGLVDVTRRLGCLGCPLASKRKRLLDFQRHPRILDMYARGASEFCASHPLFLGENGYRGVWDWLLRDVTMPSRGEWDEYRASLWYGGGLDSKTELLYRIFSIK